MKISYIDRGGGLMVDVIAKLGKRVYLKKESAYLEFSVLESR